MSRSNQDFALAEKGIIDLLGRYPPTRDFLLPFRPYRDHLGLGCNAAMTITNKTGPPARGKHVLIVSFSGFCEGFRMPAQDDGAAHSTDGRESLGLVVAWEEGSSMRTAIAPNTQARCSAG